MNACKHIVLTYYELILNYLLRVELSESDICEDIVRNGDGSGRLFIVLDVTFVSRKRLVLQVDG